MNMYSTSRTAFDDELDAIRVSIYEEIKDMTPEERASRLHAQTAQIMDEYGLKCASLVEHITL